MSLQGPQRFSHLHQHTDYSLLDGAARIKDLISWVKEVSPDRPAVAMTDHGNMHGAVQFYKTAVGAGVKPIIGFEAYVAPGSRFEKRRGSSKLDGGYFHLTLLAKDFKGYQNLCRLSSRAFLEGFYMKPRIDLELLREHSEGVIALSGCLGAQIPRTILDVGPDAGERVLLEHLSIFKENFFVELQDHGLDEQRRLNPILKAFADKHGVGMVATNDGHYVRKTDAHAHDVLLAIGTKALVSEENRMRFPCDEFYVKSPDEMAAVLPESEYPGAIGNTNVVADLCDVQLPVGSKRVYQMPELPLPEGVTLAEQLRVDSYRGLTRRYAGVDEAFWRSYAAAAGVRDVASADLGAVLLGIARAGEASVQPQVEGENFPRYRYAHLERFVAAGGLDETARTVLERVEYELGVIVAMGFPDYFLIVADFINWAKDHDIAVGPGRGSGAGSIVAYALDITNLDPLEFELLFERFLNPDRVSMPDFDIDFSDVRRGEVIDYVREKYGHDKVALIATFGTLAPRAAIKDAARVMEVSFAEADKVAKLVPTKYGRSIPIDEALKEVPELKEAYESGANAFVDVARQLEGLTRHASVHAAGVIIARHDVQELAPVFRTGDGPIVCQYDMGSIEELGFVKMDFLGLRTLSFIEAAVRIVKESRGVDLDPATFPSDDPAVFELLSKGDSAGVFQFEGSGMIDTLKRLKPRRIQDLIAVGALFRPGPMDNIPAYIRRHHGQEPIDYTDFPASERLLAPILAETYGIPVYQEQIMQIAQAVAGYTLGQADLLRRAMGKKKLEEMLKQRASFQTGAAANAVGEAESGRLFDLLERFANYGFNKSHAAAYAILSYQTAYLKAHYPVEFAAALLTVERGDSDKVAQYVADARHMGVEVSAPDVNTSRADFTPVGQLVRFGLYGIKNVGEGAVDHILVERERGGRFKDLFDFCKRVDTTVVNRRAIEYLIKSGAMDGLVPATGPGGDAAVRHLLLANLDLALKWGVAEREQAASGQFGLFGADDIAAPVLADAPAIDDLTLLRFEKEALGLYLSAHPMGSYPGLAEAASVPVDGVERHFRTLKKDGVFGGRAKVVLAGLLQNVVKRPTRKGGMMARFEVADESGSREVLAFGRTFDAVAPLLAEDAPVVAVVELSEEGEDVRAVVERLIRWDTREASQGGAPEMVLLQFPVAQVPWDQLLELRSLLDEYAGRMPVRLELEVDDDRVLYGLDGAAVAGEALDEIRRSCPWLQAKLTLDRQVLLAERSVKPWQANRSEEQAEVPF